MTDFATLAIKIDSTAAGDAARDLGQLTRAGATAEKSVDRLGNTAAQSGGQLRGAGRAAADYAADVQAAARNTQQMGEVGKLGRHHMQNLAFQFQDLGIQMSMAAQSGEPLKGMMMALMQQGSQISGIMMQAGVGVGQLAKQVVGATASFLAANPVLLAAAAAAGVVSAAFGFMSSEINKNAQTQVTWADTALGAWDAAKAFLSDQLTAAFAYFGTTTEEVWKGVVHVSKWATNWMIGAISLIPRVAIAAFQTLGPAIADGFYSGVNLAIRALNLLIKKTYDAANWAREAFNMLLPANMQLSPLSAPQISEISNQYAGAGRAAGNAFVGALKDTVTRDYVGEGAEYLSPFAQKRAQARKKAEKGAKDAGSAAGKTAAAAAADTFAEDFEKFAFANMNEFLGQMNDMEKLRQSEWAAQLSSVQDDMAKAQDERIRGAREEAEATRRLNAELRNTIDALDQLGGFGNTLGDIGAAFYGIKTGDFSGLRGPVGFLAQTFLTTFDDEGKRILNKVGQDISSALDKIFGQTGTFTRLLQSAGVGSAVGQTLFGSSNKGAQIGGAIGAVAGSFIPVPGGQIIGSLIGSTIGSLFGKRPRGSGSVTGSSLSASANDAAIRDGLDEFGAGLQQSVANIAQQLGGSVGAYSVGIGRYKDYFQVSSSANDKALGGSNFGKKSGSAVYDGLDAAAAMRAAINAAIDQGAIVGIREGAARLLKAGKDIEAQVAKALKFQSVFDELKEATDPLGAALSEIAKQFDELRSIFAEAGASAEEYAQLEQLLAIKRQEAADETRQTVLDKIRDPFEMQIRMLELLGREEDALAATRLLELAGIKGALQPLQAMIYQLEDARKVIDTFEPLAADLRAFREELLGGGSKQSLGTVAAKFQAIAAAAANGDAAAMGMLRGAGSDYLAQARLSAGSDLEYRRALGTVLAGVDGGIFAADTQVDYAQAQIDAINNSAAILERMRSEMAVLQTQIAENTGFVARLWQRFEVDGLPIANTQDGPVQVEVVA